MLNSKKTSKNELKVPPVPVPSLTIVMVPVLGKVGDSRNSTSGFTVLCKDSATISIGMAQLDPEAAKIKHAVGSTPNDGVRRSGTDRHALQWIERAQRSKESGLDRFEIVGPEQN